LRNHHTTAILGNPDRAVLETVHAGAQASRVHVHVGNEEFVVFLKQEERKNTVLRGIKNFTTVDLPMVGTGRIMIAVDNASLTTMDSVKQALFANIKTSKVFDTRISSCLRAADIDFVYEILLYETEEMRKFRNFGKDSVKKLEEYFQRNQINAEVIEKIKHRYAELALVEIGTIPSVAESGSFLTLKNMVASIEDIGLISIEAWTGGNGKQNYYRSSFLGKNFPYRHQGDNFPKTKYEERHTEADLKNLVFQINQLVLDFQRRVRSHRKSLS
jgi:hypothetical protein